MNTRVGKIARLPREVREQLNLCLKDGEIGKRLVDWLNTLPEVKAVLAGEFNGRAISEQNLSEWKTGGYRDWEMHQERRELFQQLAEQAQDLEAPDKNGEFNRNLSVVLAADLAQAARAALAQTDDAKERLEICGQFVGKFTQLRREESSAERVRVSREQWQAAQNQTEADRKTNHALFPIYAALVHRSFMGLMDHSSPETQAGTAQVLERLLDKRKSRQPATNATTEGNSSAQFKPVQGKSSQAEAAGQTESNQIRPNQTEIKPEAIRSVISISRG